MGYVDRTSNSFGSRLCRFEAHIFRHSGKSGTIRESNRASVYVRCK